MLAKLPLYCTPTEIQAKKTHTNLGRNAVTGIHVLWSGTRPRVCNHVMCSIGCEKVASVTQCTCATSAYACASCADEALYAQHARSSCESFSLDINHMENSLSCAGSLASLIFQAYACFIITQQYTASCSCKARAMPAWRCLPRGRYNTKDELGRPTAASIGC